jgi:membrane-associated phospholipid phosphatase
MDVVTQPIALPADDRRLRPHEVLTATYLVVTGLLGAVFGSLSDWWPMIATHAVAVAVIVFVIPRLPPRRWIDALRDWLPVLALPLLYAEVGRLDRLISTGYHDGTISAVDQALFGRPGIALRAYLPWGPFVEYLHFSYVAYYVLLPLLGGALYLRGRRREFRYVLAVVLGTFYVCYVCFILFPVAGPWYRRPHPSYAHMNLFFPGVVQQVLEHWASKGAAFPSSHVAVAVVIWLLAWRLARRVFWLLALIVPALALGTVYGGFHYTIDAGAGLLVGIAGYLVGPRIVRWLGGHAPGDPELRVGD